MSRRAILLPTIAAAAGLVGALAVTTGLVVLIEGTWPDDLSRMVGHQGWLGWAGLLSLAHAIGGALGGALIGLVDRSRPAKTALWSAVVTLVVLSMPALGAFDRPIEMASMLLLNLVTSVALVGGAAIVARVVRRSQPAAGRGAKIWAK